jgi:hypothetical protein
MGYGKHKSKDRLLTSEHAHSGDVATSEAIGLSMKAFA